MAIRKLKDGRWAVYYRIRDGSKSRVKWEYFGRGPEAQARAGKRNSELNLKRRRPANINSGPLVAELAKHYSNYKNFSPNSKKHLDIRLEVNILPHFGALPASRLTYQDLDNYVQYRRTCQKKDKDGNVIKTGVKWSTIRRELVDLQAILNWSTGRIPPLIPFNPVRDYKKPAEDLSIILPPTEKETAKILSHAPDHLRRAILLSYFTGLRPGAVELLQLKFDDINWRAKTILVRSAEKGGPRRRDVPLHKKFIKTLKQWQGGDDSSQYIITWQGSPVKSIKKSWKTTLKNAGITRRIRPYDLRHGFITTALEAGADLKALSEVVGSRPETIMRHYQHVSRALRRAAVETIPAAPAIQNIAKKPKPKNKKGP